MSTKELEIIVHELRELRLMKEELEAEICNLEDTIKAEMGDREQMTVGAFKIDWKTITSSRIDTIALKKAFPEIAECFMRQTTTRRFCVR